MRINSLQKMVMVLSSTMIITSLPIAVTADELQEWKQLIEESAQRENTHLSEEELNELVNIIQERSELPDLPASTFCWATSVETYHPGNPEPKSSFANPLQILGPPDSYSIIHTHSVSLGNTQEHDGPYGEITVDLGGSFAAQPGKNLYLYEVGTDKESVYVQVRRQDTGTYHPADPGLLITSDFPAMVELSQFGVATNIPLNALRIRDAVDGNQGAVAAGADIDAVSIDCSAFQSEILAVEILSIETIVIEDGIAILWQTGVMNEMAKMKLMRVPVMADGQLDKENAKTIRTRKPYPTQNYAALDALPPPGRYAYVIKEITDKGEQIWHDDKNRGEIAIIEIK